MSCSLFVLNADQKKKILTTQPLSATNKWILDLHAGMPDEGFDRIRRVTLTSMAPNAAQEGRRRPSC